MRIALSIVGLTALCFAGGQQAHSALTDDIVATLDDDRWERRDPFSPLIEPSANLNVQTSVAPDPAKAQDEPYRYRAEGRRDPFRSVLEVDQSPIRTDGPLTPLEQFEPSQLRLVGIMWNSNGYRALLETPDGMAYTARSGTAIGASGIVSRVSEEHMVVRQSVRNVFGEEKFREVELNLYPKKETMTLSSESILADLAENRKTTHIDGGLLRGDQESGAQSASPDLLE